MIQRKPWWCLFLSGRVNEKSTTYTGISGVQIGNIDLDGDAGCHRSSDGVDNSGPHQIHERRRGPTVQEITFVLLLLLLLFKTIR